VVAGRCFEAGFRPVLRLNGNSREKEKDCSDGKLLGTRDGELHGEEFSH
jgi:hypothetical protein